jgi:hypothetical protein
MAKTRVKRMMKTRKPPKTAPTVVTMTMKMPLKKTAPKITMARKRRRRRRRRSLSQS